MAISFFDGKKEYLKNHIRSKKLKDGYLVTTDHGAWVYLSEEEYLKLKTQRLDEPLISFLKDKGVLLTSDNVQQLIRDYRKRVDYLFQGTSLHIVVVTLRCNLRCLYCHSKAKPINAEGYDMDEQTAKKTVDFIFQSPSNSLMIEFQGGEPLLNFDIVKFIVKYAKEKNKIYKKNLRFSIVTNLVFMTDEIFDFLRKEGVGICTSLDGTKEVHNKNRAEYDKTVSWIKKIKTKYTINAMLLVTKQSLPYYKEIVDEYLALGLNTIWIKPVNYLGYALEHPEELIVKTEDFLDFWKKSLKYLVEINNGRKRPLKENFTTIILKKILGKRGFNFTDLQSPCGAAIGQLAYSQNGDIYTCDEGRLFDIFKLGTVNDKYKDIMKSSEVKCIVQASINDNPVCEICAYKPYCGLCPVCAYSEFSNIIPKVPDRRCKIFKGMFDHTFEKIIFDEDYKKVFFKWFNS